MEAQTEMLLDHTPLKRNRKRADERPHWGDVVSHDGATIHYNRAESLYDYWPAPICIISDGPYGISGFPGDQHSAATLAGWYRPHIEAWSRLASPQTTLWFWNTEIGWASVHSTLAEFGWEYRGCHIWDKGISHVAGNVNTATIRKFPVVTEVCVQYVRAPLFRADGQRLSMQDWLRYEWQRTGLPLYLANKACGVLNAASRKYLTKDHLWYYPPPDAFAKLVEYANRHGKAEGRPYFSVDGEHSLTADEWALYRAKFNCDLGITNVWRELPVRGAERIQGERSRMRWKYASLHGSQKPLRLMDLCISASTDPGDAVWEPFGGLCSATVAAQRLGRLCVAAEIVPEFFLAAAGRIRPPKLSVVR